MEQRRAAQLEDPVEVRRLANVAVVADIADAGVLRLIVAADVRRPIGRGIVGDDDLEIGQALGEQGIQRFRQILLAIVRGNSNRHFRHVRNPSAPGCAGAHRAMLARPGLCRAEAAARRRIRSAPDQLQDSRKPSCLVRTGEPRRARWQSAPVRGRPLCRGYALRTGCPGAPPGLMEWSCRSANWRAAPLVRDGHDCLANDRGPAGRRLSRLSKSFAYLGAAAALRRRDRARRVPAAEAAHRAWHLGGLAAARLAAQPLRPRPADLHRVRRLAGRARRRRRRQPARYAQVFRLQLLYFVPVLWHVGRDSLSRLSATADSRGRLGQRHLWHSRSWSR